MSAKSKPRWVGPKEWRPARPDQWLESPLLSKEENKRISFLFAESKRTHSNITPEDAAWLCLTIKKLAQQGPDDYSFPTRLALYNPMGLSAFAMRYQDTPLIEFSYHFRGPFLGATLLNKTTSSPVTGAVMLIRPYIRICQGDPAAVLSLRQSTIIMEVDGEKVLRTPIDEHLILEDGSFPRKNRWKVGPLRNMTLFMACHLDEAKNAYPSMLEGIACVNGSMIVVSLLRETLFDGEITLVTGLVAANYVHDGSTVTPTGTAPILGAAP